MSTFKGILLTLWITAVAAFTGRAQQVHTYVDRDSISVGEILQYTIVFERDREYRTITFPREETMENDTLQFVSRERHRVSAMRDSLIYRLQFFGLEDYEIPRFRITLIDMEGETSDVETNLVPLYFRTVLAEGDEEFRPLKPIFDFAAALWHWILLLLILALTGWYLYRRFRHREVPEAAPEQVAEPVPFSNPFDRLERTLTGLGGRKSPLNTSDFKEFYVRLGDSIRQYFEDVYDIKALEMTSREILLELNRHPADPGVIRITRKVLNEADMVKFAKFEPTIDQARRSLGIATDFLETVRDIDRTRVEELKILHQQTELNLKASYSHESAITV